MGPLTISSQNVYEYMLNQLRPSATGQYLSPRCLLGRLADETRLPLLSGLTLVCKAYF